MRKVICTFVMMLFFLFNDMSVNNKETVEQENVQIIEVTSNAQITHDEYEEKKIEIPEKTIEEVKQEELNCKLNKIKHIKENNKKEWFLAYKDLVFEYIEWFDKPETVFDVFSEEEVDLICRVVETETYDQDFDSKVNVACVVFNRLESGRFGNTITEVVTKPYQFAYGRRNITEDTILAVMYAYEIEDTTQGSLYFNSFKTKKDTFCGASYVFTDDCGHHFYKPKEDK